jgi:hypothetical protein
LYLTGSGSLGPAPHSWKIHRKTQSDHGQHQAGAKVVLPRRAYLAICLPMFGSGAPKARSSWYFTVTRLISSWNDETYNSNRHVATGNKKTFNALIEKGVQLELCGATAKGNHWGNADLLPGVKVNVNAMVRVTQLEQDGYTLIYTAFLPEVDTYVHFTSNLPLFFQVWGCLFPLGTHTQMDLNWPHPNRQVNAAGLLINLYFPPYKG